MPKRKFNIGDAVQIKGLLEGRYTYYFSLADQFKRGLREAIRRADRDLSYMELNRKFLEEIQDPDNMIVAEYQDGHYRIQSRKYDHSRWMPVRLLEPHQNQEEPWE